MMMRLLMLMLMLKGKAKGRVKVVLLGVPKRRRSDDRLGISRFSSLGLNDVSNRR